MKRHVSREKRKGTQCLNLPQKPSGQQQIKPSKPACGELEGKKIVKLPSVSHLAQLLCMNGLGQICFCDIRLSASSHIRTSVFF